MITNRIFFTSVFILTLFAGDRLVGWGLKKIYFSQKSGERYAITYALDSTRAELLIFGNSRAARHYVPTIFEDSLHITCFNTGKDGEGISYNYAMLLGIMSRYTPACILLDINTDAFYKKRNRPDNLISLIPYVNNGHPEIRDLVVQRNKFESLKLFSAIYPFNSTLVSSLKGLNKSISGDLKGYMPLYGHLKNESLPVFKKEAGNQIDESKIQDLINFIDICTRHHITLYVVQSPRFIVNSEDSVKVILKDVCTKKGVSFFDYTNFITKSIFFKDEAHLNNDGAVLFSNMLALSIKYKS